MKKQSKLLTLKRKLKLKQFCLLGLLLCGTSAVYADRLVGKSDISLPEKTVEGHLPNGLHYLILPNELPGHTAEMRLVMRLGSVQETEEQKGSAHFLEHMAFGGTKHYPGRGMVEYLEGLGMKYGRDINAVTGYDRTIFMLSVPMGKEDTAVLDSTLLILKDWLTDITFDAERAAKERGVILEELRGYDQGDDFYDLKIGQSRFAQRMPLGSSEDIRSIGRPDLLKFYQKWYTPQLASVVVVGDVSPQEVEKRIRTLFGGIRQKPIPDYQTYPLAYTKGVQLKEMTDTLPQKSILELMIPHPCVVGRDLTSTADKETGNLLVDAINSRFLMFGIPCTVSDNWYLSDKNHFVLSCSGTSRDSLLHVVEAASCELYRLVREGWCSPELNHLKQAFVERLSPRGGERSSAAYCDDFADYILSGDRYIYASEEMDALKEKIMGVGSARLQALLEEWLGWKEQSLLVAYQNHAGTEQSLQSSAVLKAWREGAAREPRVFNYCPVVKKEMKIVTPVCLQEMHSFQASDIASETRLEAIHVRDIRLKNGLRLVLRPTPNGSETLLFELTGRGGTADLPADRYHALEGTAGFIEMGGIEKVDYDTLTAYTCQENVLVNVTLGHYWHGLLGTAPVGKSQELFNLIYEKLHRPELRYKDFEEIRQDELESVGEESLLERLMHQASDRMLANRMDSLAGNIPSVCYRERTVADVKSMDLDEIGAYYRSLFTDPEETTLIVTGDFKEDEVLPQLVATFGRMKSPAEKAHRAATVPQPSQGPYVEGFEGGNDTQTILEYVSAGRFEPSLRGGLTLKLMRDVLQNRLLTVLREKENIVYSPYVSLFYNGAPRNNYYFNLSLSVDSSNTELTDKKVKEIVAGLGKHPISQDELDKLKRSFRVNKRQVLTEEAATDWRKMISLMIQNGESLSDFNDYDACLDAITTEDIRSAFQHQMNPAKMMLLYIGTHRQYPSKK